MKNNFKYLAVLVILMFSSSPVFANVEIDDVTVLDSQSTDNVIIEHEDKIVIKNDNVEEVTTEVDNDSLKLSMDVSNSAEFSLEKGSKSLDFDAGVELTLDKKVNLEKCELPIELKNKVVLSASGKIKLKEVYAKFGNFLFGLKASNYSDVKSFPQFSYKLDLTKNISVLSSVEKAESALHYIANDDKLKDSLSGFTIKPLTYLSLAVVENICFHEKDKFDVYVGGIFKPMPYNVQKTYNYGFGWGVKLGGSYTIIKDFSKVSVSGLFGDGVVEYFHKEFGVDYEKSINNVPTNNKLELLKTLKAGVAVEQYIVDKFLKLDVSYSFMSYGKDFKVMDYGSQMHDISANLGFFIIPKKLSVGLGYNIVAKKENKSDFILSHKVPLVVKFSM